MFIILKLIYFVLFPSSVSNLEMSWLQQSPDPWQFPHLDVVIAMDTMPSHWPFIFWALHYLYP